ncbi:MAG TPA: roadblock/LC7 domain-containing protein [Gemmatimonadaceae bacterium]|nr:roadblock/LC7 domain-containing protein [Gemmatimonadaceae bacterium]
MSDEIRRLSDELARDPGSLVFLPLGEKLRRQGQLDLALKVAVRGLERHPHNADAHDLLARIAVDRGELQRAFDEWDMVLRFSPAHAGAKKGMGFVCFRQGKLADAERYLSEAIELDATDQSAVAALAHVRLRLGRSPAEVASAAPPGSGSPASAYPPLPPRRSGEAVARGSGQTAAREAAEPAWLLESIRNAPQPQPEAPPEPVLDPTERAALSRNPRALFADLIGEADQTALLLDADGFVLAGAYLSGDGRDVAQEVGAELSGVSDEAQRAMRHFDLGSWTSIVVETQVATIALAPGPRDGLLLVAADGAMPLGMVRRFLDRCAARARAFVGGMR